MLLGLCVCVCVCVCVYSVSHIFYLDVRIPSQKRYFFEKIFCCVRNMLPRYTVDIMFISELFVMYVEKLLMRWSQHQ